MTANISRILAAGLGPVSPVGPRSSGGAGFPDPRNNCRLEAQFWEQWPAAIGLAVKTRRAVMNNIIWLVGAVVIVIAILSFLGLG
ncbi:MAG: hypothetical protein EOS50_03720 [Mesorhizobium sp.]|nr:MAG: hypothetical protein EOS50_03720 [Mesorhizobium sp.]TIY07594.1 MAG: hypothetical protein E5V18_09490 [Mesorhizobium sp.]